MSALGAGRTAEMFEHGAGRIVKLYRVGFPRDAVEYEYEMNRIVAALGVPAPRALGRVEIDGRAGIVFERAEGATLLHRMFRRPGEGSRFAKEFADLHVGIHRFQVDAGTHPSILNRKTALARNIRNAPQLSNEVKTTLLRHTERLPDGNALCHGDYHPDNVISGERPWVIDWMTAAIGDPAGDVARTLLLFRYGTPPEGAPPDAVEALRRSRNEWSDAYLERYLDRSGMTPSRIEEWTLPVAAARLTEWIPEEEKAQLLRLIEKAMR
ncbi:phosphotransferase [Paenibacillus sp.]|uniref:phosphotransferase family protein n=1 Tax=Paenibacillus sp. TaxID=58172 RepID=UPI002810B913|nr:phosphotransferase [Paenibacillus sp.]